MRKSFFITQLFFMLCVLEVISQPATVSSITGYTYHHPSEDKESWQRLNLLLSTWYLKSATSGLNPDSSLIYVSRSLGLSRLLIAAEGIDDQELLTQSQWFDQRNPGNGVLMLSKFTGKKHLEIMILLGSYYAFQENKELYKDSAQYFLQKAIEESKALNEKKLCRVALCLLGKTYLQLIDWANSETVFNKLLKECKSDGDKKTEARALTYQGLYTIYRQSSYPAAITRSDIIKQKIQHLEDARKVYHELNNIEGEVGVLVNASYLQMGLSLFDEAYVSLQTAMQLQNKISFPYTHYTADNIAMLTTAQGKFGEPLKYSLEAVRVGEAARDSIGWGAYYTRLATLYYIEGHREDESLKWMLKALGRFVAAKDPNVYQTLNNVVSIMSEKPGQEQNALDLALMVSKKVTDIDSSDRIYQYLTFATCYLGLKQFKLAEQFVQSADSIHRTGQYESFNSISEKTAINIILASIYFGSGQYNKSKKLLETELNNESRIPTIINDISIYKKLIFIDSVFNDATSGIKHYRLYTELIDSNFRISKIRQGEELQIMYQTKDKEDQIAILNQQAKLEQANLKEATLIKQITIAGIIVTMLIAGLLYRQSRIRKQNNKIITSKGEQLQHLLTEKEWLLKEIHHRVKNNLQTVVSLLESQSAYLSNNEALLAIQDSQHRVHAMSLIHQKLYQGDNVASINMGVYLPELVNYLRDSFNVQQQIKFDLTIDSVDLDVSQAIPLGLILNEAITNSIKYAFTKPAVNSIITIGMQQQSDNRIELLISDNGKGLPHSLDNNKIQGLGLKLMKGLTEDIDGNFSIVTDNGTKIRISFTANTPLYKFNEIALPTSIQKTA